MKRTSISALAASALVVAFAASPAAAEGFSVKEGQELLREFFPCS